jgi:hypothetical protein
MSKEEHPRERVRRDESFRIQRLGDELDQLIKLVSWARESLQNELYTGMGYRKEALGESDLRKLKDLTTTVNSAVEAKIKWDKSQKSLADSMTPEEERAAVVAYIKSLDLEQYREFMVRVKRA